METVEVIVYMAIALIVGTLIIAFIGGWDAKGTYAGIKGIFSGKSDARYQEIAAADLPKETLAAWESCGLGTTDLNRTLYVRDAVPLNKTMIFERIKQANLCRSLQWADAGCGTRDDVVFSDTMGPAVLGIRCDAATRKLIITS